MEVIITICNLSKHEFVYSLETQLIAKITDIEQRYVATILKRYDSIPYLLTRVMVNALILFYKL